MLISTPQQLITITNPGFPTKQKSVLSLQKDILRVPSPSLFSPKNSSVMYKKDVWFAAAVFSLLHLLLYETQLPVFFSGF